MSGDSKVDAYLAALPEPARGTLTGLRSLIQTLVPEAVEGFGYGIPAYKYHGRPLTYFAAARKHCALYALDTTLAEQAGYKTAKGTIRFPPDAPPPESLIKELLERRIAAIEAEARSTGRKAPAREG